MLEIDCLIFSPAPIERPRDSPQTAQTCFSPELTMDHGRARPCWAVHRVATDSSGVRGAIERVRNVVSDTRISCGFATRRQTGGSGQFGYGRRQCAHADHPAALTARGLVVIGRSAGVVQGLRRPTDAFMASSGLNGCRMIVYVTIGVDVGSSSAGIVVNVDDAHRVFVFGQARSGTRAIREGKRKRRRQHAKHVDQGKELTCPQSRGPGQACQQPSTSPRDSFVDHELARTQVLSQAAAAAPSGLQSWNRTIRVGEEPLSASAVTVDSGARLLSQSLSTAYTDGGICRNPDPSSVMQTIVEQRRLRSELTRRLIA